MNKKSISYSVKLINTFFLVSLLHISIKKSFFKILRNQIIFYSKKKKKKRNKSNDLLSSTASDSSWSKLMISKLLQPTYVVL